MNNLIDKYKDLNYGFVVGAGPSLRHVNQEQLQQLSKYPVIAINSAISKFKSDYDSCNLYFLSDDKDCIAFDYFHNIRDGVTKLLYKEKIAYNSSYLNTIYFKHKTWYDHINNKYNPEGLVFTKDEPIIGARTSSGSAVHFQYIFGVKTIVLLGMDCCCENNKRYFWEFPPESPCRRIDGKTVVKSNIVGKKDGKHMDVHSFDFIKYWEALAEQAKNQNIRIINASGGVLNCFEKKSLREILDEKETSNS